MSNQTTIIAKKTSPAITVEHKGFNLGESGVSINKSYVNGVSNETGENSVPNLFLPGARISYAELANGYIQDPNIAFDSIVVIEKGVSTDIAGMGTVGPTGTITGASAPSTNPFNVTIVMSEAVTGLVSGDFTVTNGTAGTLSTSDSITFTLAIAPTGAGVVTVTLPRAKCTGNTSKKFNRRIVNSGTITYTP